MVAVEGQWILVLLACASGAFVAWWGWGAVEVRRRRARARGSLSREPLRRRRVGKIEFKRKEEERRLEIERHVPEMIDALGLGMRAGLSFEGAFRLYCQRFDDELAQACAQACRGWESGLVTRDAALRAMAQECGVETLTRFVENVERCLRFGSPMGRMLDMLAAEARSCYKAKMEEKVARAPVKMMAPTAALILPAMLIMVMAPVMLEFA